MSSSPADPPAPVAGYRWLAAGCMAAALGLALYPLLRPPTDPATPSANICRDAPERAELPPLDRWAPHSGPTRAIVRRDLEAWLARSAQARAEACDAAPASEPVIACLDAQTSLARAAIAALSTADEAAQARAWRVPLALPLSEDCGHAPQRPPSEAATAAQRAAIDTAWIAADLGVDPSEVAGPLAVVEDVIAENSGSRAAALFVRARHTPETATRLDQLERALWEAVATDRPALGFRIALHLAQDSGTRFDDAQRWWKLATAFDRRLPQAGPRQHALVQAQARLLLSAGQPQEALALFEVTLSLAESLHSGQHPALVEDLMLSAVAAVQTDRIAAADALATRALSVVDAALGAKHPLANEMLATYIDALIAAQEPAAAAVWARESIRRASPQRAAQRAVAAGRAALAAQDTRAAADAFAEASRTVGDAVQAEQPELRIQIELGLAAAASAEGDDDAALGHLRTALAAAPPTDTSRARVLRTQLISTLASLDRFEEASAEARILLEGLNPDQEPIPTAEALLTVGDVALRSGRAAEGLRVAERALQLLSAADTPADAQILLALTQVGRACLALDRNTDAVATFERALTLAAAAALPLEEQGATRLALASALWRGRARTRAEAEARAAYRDIARALGEEDAEATAGAWLAQRGLSPHAGAAGSNATEGNPPLAPAAPR